mmetsp:Transcript_87157/g.281498  ORF Transcript_87157/g.281498 Transcript_87157/m.281498 type:complete len:862 (-) Transcript_87157:131-2716(-)
MSLSSFGSPKSQDLKPEERAFLLKALQKHFLFQDLEECERSDIAALMRPQHVEAGAVICAQGEVGDCCFVIQKGLFHVAIEGQVVKHLTAGQTFGELAMLYSVSRTASVTCHSAGILWKMDGPCFRLCMHRLTNKHLQRALGFLAMDPGFRALSETERRKLAGACAVQKFAQGDQVLRLGEQFHCLFIVVEGTLKTLDSKGHTSLRRAGSILGCAALMLDKQVITKAEAVDNVTCLVVAKHSLERLIGPVEDVLRRSAVKALLSNCFTDVEIMRQLSEDQQNVFVDSLEQATFEAGEVVVARGSPPEFVLVLEGEVALFRPPSPAASAASAARAESGRSPTKLTAGMAHGASNLVDNAAMREEIVATTRTSVRRISYLKAFEAFHEPLSDLFRFKEVKKALGEILLFKNLNDEQMDRVVRCLERQSYKKGDIVVRQGEDASHFYLIQSGSMKVSKNGQQVRMLGRWDAFGERGLLLEESRAATVSAQEPCVCLILGNAAFHTIVGMFRGELEQRMKLQDLDISMKDLRVRAIVGRGNFGVVKLVYHRDDDSRCYALKCVNKQMVVQQGQQKCITMEREVNAQCNHACLVQFIRTFQDVSNVYFLTEFLGGGELFHAMRDIGKLAKEQVQFYAGSMVLALEYLHGRGFIYRDLKPENVMLDGRGYPKLVDFGCCKKASRTSTVVGTPEYMAPEVIAMLGYTCAIDWWALGVVMHELVVGPLPFGAEAEDELELFRAIREAPLRFPSRVTDSTAISVISGLLKRTPEMRLGASKQGATEIKEHPYFLDFDWDGLAGRYLSPPWRPNLEQLQSHWELCDGKPVQAPSDVEDDAPWLRRVASLASFVDLVGPRRVQRGMEWATEF